MAFSSQRLLAIVGPRATHRRCNRGDAGHGSGTVPGGFVRPVRPGPVSKGEAHAHAVLRVSHSTAFRAHQLADMNSMDVLWRVARDDATSAAGACRPPQTR